MAVSRPYRNKKSEFPSRFIFGTLLSRKLNYRPEKKIPRFLVEEGWNGPKNGPKENKGKLKERKSPLLKKRKASNELAWGHCEKRYNTWLCQMTVYRPCRNQKNRHCSQDACSGYFYLGDWIINRKKKQTPIMVQRTGQKKIRENSRKVNHHFSKIKGLEWVSLRALRKTI